MSHNIYIKSIDSSFACTQAANPHNKNDFDINVMKFTGLQNKVRYVSIYTKRTIK